MDKFNEFIKEVQERLPEYLPDEYRQARIVPETVMKNNGVKKTGLAVLQPDNNIGPVIYMDGIYREYKKGATMEKVMEEVSGIYLQNVSEKLNFKNFNPTEYDTVKENLTIRLINKKENSQLLSQMPYKEVEDLAIVYEISLPDPSEKSAASVKVTNTLMTVWELDADTLHQTAMENFKRVTQPSLITMQTVMQEMISGDSGGANLLEDKDAFLRNNRETIYILSNSRNWNGSAVLLYPGVCERIAEVFPEGFYILPSSVHELLVVPKTGAMTPKELGKMVCEVNRNKLMKDDRLSDRIYEYDKEAKFRQVPESIKNRKGREER